MEQCAMTPGTMKMPLSSAINWDSLLMVYNTFSTHSYPLAFKKKTFIKRFLAFCL